MISDVVIAESVTKRFRIGDTPVNALTNVNLTIEMGEFLAIVGPSGSGKTTFFNILGCIEKPTSGRVKINGIDTTSLSPDDLACLRANHMGFVFQTFNLIPVLTALENVEYPILKRKMTKEERKERATASLREVGLERFAHHKPSELSGGQRQRVAIARALIGTPSIILADEPTANLDHKTSLEIIDLMKGLNGKLKTTFIFSTNDSKIMALANRIIELVSGEIRNS